GGNGGRVGLLVRVGRPIEVLGHDADNLRNAQVEIAGDLGAAARLDPTARRIEQRSGHVEIVDAIEPSEAAACKPMPAVRLVVNVGEDATDDPLAALGGEQRESREVAEQRVLAGKRPAEVALQ